MKKFRKIALLLTLSMLVITVFSGCVRKKTEEITAAVVNGEEITLADFEKMVDLQKKQYETQYQFTEDTWKQEVEEGKTYEAFLKENVLENMITEMLLMQKADEEQIQITDEQIEEEFTKLRENFETDEAYNQFLELNGYTEESLKDMIRKDFTLNEYLTKVIDAENIDDEAAKAYYDENINEYKQQVDARHILVKTEDEAKTVIDRIDKGEDFAELAKELSLDTTSAAIGGDLGSFGRNIMVPEFEDAAFSLEPGEISDPIQTIHGYHVIEVKNYDLYNFEDIKGYIIQQIENEKVNVHIEELKNNAQIEKKVKIK